MILPPETWNANRDQVAGLLTRPRSTAQQARCAGSTAAGRRWIAHGCSGGARPAAGDGGRVQRLRIAALRRVSLRVVPGRVSGRRVLQTMPAKARRTDRPDGGVAPRYVTGGRRAVPGAPSRSIDCQHAPDVAAAVGSPGRRTRGSALPARRPRPGQRRACRRVSRAREPGVTPVRGPPTTVSCAGQCSPWPPAWSSPDVALRPVRARRWPLQRPPPRRPPSPPPRPHQQRRRPRWAAHSRRSRLERTRSARATVAGRDANVCHPVGVGASCHDASPLPLRCLAPAVRACRSVTLEWVVSDRSATRPRTATTGCPTTTGPRRRGPVASVVPRHVRAERTPATGQPGHAAPRHAPARGPRGAPTSQPAPQPGQRHNPRSPRRPRPASGQAASRPQPARPPSHSDRTQSSPAGQRVAAGWERCARRTAPHARGFGASRSVGGAGTSGPTPSMASSTVAP